LVINYNCAYRYRLVLIGRFAKKGKDGGIQEEKVFWAEWLYQGSEKAEKAQSIHISTINTIYVNERKCFLKSPFGHRSRGVFGSQNYFSIYGRRAFFSGRGDQYSQMHQKNPTGN